MPCHPQPSPARLARHAVGVVHSAGAGRGAGLSGCTKLATAVAIRLALRPCAAARCANTGWPANDRPTQDGTAHVGCRHNEHDPETTSIVIRWLSQLPEHPTIKQPTTSSHTIHLLNTHKRESRANTGCACVVDIREGEPHTTQYVPATQTPPMYR